MLNPLGQWSNWMKKQAEKFQDIKYCLVFYLISSFKILNKRNHKKDWLMINLCSPEFEKKVFWRVSNLQFQYKFDRNFTMPTFIQFIQLYVKEEIIHFCIFRKMLYFEITQFFQWFTYFQQPILFVTVNKKLLFAFISL